jgi:imidazolonepropionase-like amidohydrolase
VNPAAFLRLDHRVGALREGLDGDVVLWSGDPLDVMSRAEQVFIEGRSVFRYESGVPVTVERAERFTG